MPDSGVATLSGRALSRLASLARVYLLDRVTSTNDYALGLADRLEPAIVVARRQTKGRGRFHRHWFSDDSSLTFSLLLFPDMHEFAKPLLTHVAGLSVCRAIEAVTSARPLLRWPNDVLLGDRKIAGILCEAKGLAMAVGIGLNVNQTEFPPDLPEAGSLLQATGRTWDELELLEGCVRQMLGSLDRAARGETHALMAEVKERSCTLLRRIEVKTLLRTHVGTCLDVDDQGRIIIRTDSGRLVMLNSGQVRRLR